MYVEHTLEEDKETVKAWNDDLDSILIFVRHPVCNLFYTLNDTAAAINRLPSSLPS